MWKEIGKIIVQFRQRGLGGHIQTIIAANGKQKNYFNFAAGRRWRKMKL